MPGCATSEYPDPSVATLTRDTRSSSAGTEDLGPEFSYDSQIVSAAAAEVEDAIALLAGRVRARVAGGLIEEMVARYQDEIVDYHALDAERLADVHAFSSDNCMRFLANLERDEPLGADDLAEMRGRAARRVHQDVALSSLLQAFRIWGSMLWTTVLEAARPDRPAEREAALLLAGRVLAHVDLVSTACTQGYVEEAEGVWHDREVMRRDLLDWLLGGQEEPERLRREAASLRLQLSADYLVVVVRGPDHPEGDGPTPLSVRAGLRQAVEIIKQRLHPSSGSLLVGVRQGEVVALYPTPAPTAVDRAKRECAALAEALAPRGFSVALGSRHPGLAGIPTGYAEARETLAFARRRSLHGRALAFDEILVEHALRSSRQAERVLADTLQPLSEYDARRHSELVETLRAYFESGFNGTRAAERLSVHPNTVVYRLRRVHELTGRDPCDPDDLLLLVLGLKVLAARGS
jgi:sugar diacid utilization regulator